MPQQNYEQPREHDRYKQDMGRLNTELEKHALTIVDDNKTAAGIVNETVTRITKRIENGAPYPSKHDRCENETAASKDKTAADHALEYTKKSLRLTANAWAYDQAIKTLEVQDKLLRKAISLRFTVSLQGGEKSYSYKDAFSTPEELVKKAVSQVRDRLIDGDITFNDPQASVEHTVSQLQFTARAEHYLHLMAENMNALISHGNKIVKRPTLRGYDERGQEDPNRRIEGEDHVEASDDIANEAIISIYKDIIAGKVAYKESPVNYTKGRMNLLKREIYRRRYGRNKHRTIELTYDNWLYKYPHKKEATAPFENSDDAPQHAVRAAISHVEPGHFLEMLASVSGYANFQYEVRMHSTDETACRKLRDLIHFAQGQDNRLTFDFNYTALNDRRDNLHHNAPVAPSPKTDPVTLHDDVATAARQLTEQARHYLRLNLSDPKFRGGNFNRQRALEKVCSRVHLRTDDAGETLKWFRSTDCSDFDPDLADFTSFENNEFWPQFEDVLPQESMLVLHSTHWQISEVLRIDPKTFLQQMKQECRKNYSIRIHLDENRVTVVHRNGKLSTFSGDEQGETSDQLTKRLTGIDPPFALQYQLITWRYKDRIDETIIKDKFEKKFDEFRQDIREWQSSLKPLP